MEENRYAPYAATLLRLALGSMWISHALLKALVFTLPGFAAFLAAKGLPSFAAWPVFLMEITGGIAILLGWHGRIVSVLLLPVMATALWTHLPNGWVFTNANGGWEYPAFLLLASLVHVLQGDGALALSDRGESVRAVPAY